MTTPTAPSISLVLSAIFPAITVSVREITGSMTPDMIAGIAKRLISWVVIRFKIYILFNFNSSVNSAKLHYFLKIANIFLFFYFNF